MDVSTLSLSDRIPWLDAEWRWTRAQLLAEHDRPTNHQDDLLVDQAREYVLLRRHEPGAEVPPHLQAIATAERLATGPQLARLGIEARILAGQDNAAIAQRTTVPEPVLDAFEKLFCDCREKLQADGWVRNNVIHTEGFPGGVPTLRGTILTQAYYGGPQVTEDVLACLRRCSHLVGDMAAVDDVTNGLSDLERQILLAINMMMLPVTQETLPGILRDYSRLLQVQLDAAARSAAAHPVDMATHSDPWANIQLPLASQPEPLVASVARSAEAA